MSTGVVFRQMLVIFAMIAVGIWMDRKAHFSEETSKDLSYLVTHVCNPALLVTGALGDTSGIGSRDFLFVLLAGAFSYLLLILMGFLLPRLLRVEKDERKFYHMMCVYGNIGFIGIPVVAAVFGTEALIYVSIFNLEYNLLVYTHGIRVLESGMPGEKGLPVKRLVNPGTAAALLTIVLFFTKIQLPKVIADCFTYAGNATTILAMVILGISLSHIAVKEIFSEKRFYLFVPVRYILLPVCFGIFMRFFTDDMMIVGVSVLMMSMPAGNMPLMLARERKLECGVLARGIMFTTILSLITITVTVYAVDLITRLL